MDSELSWSAPSVVQSSLLVRVLGAHDTRRAKYFALGTCAVRKKGKISRKKGSQIRRQQPMMGG